MADKTLNVRVKHRYDTEANWTSKNPVLLAGELAFSKDKNGRYKVGDGTSKWADLQIRSNLEQNQDLLSKQITDFSNMMKDYINVQNARTIASFRSSLWRMHRDFTNQGYITADGLKTFLEMGKLYEDAGGNDIYHSKLLPEITALEIKYSKDDIIDKI